MEITVVVGSATVVAENEAHHVKALAVPSSVICIIIMSPATGVPERFVVNDVIACAKPVIVNMSPLSVFIVGVADCVVDTTRLVIRLFVRVDVELMVGIVTPSTAITPADTREIVASEAFQSSMFPVVVRFATKAFPESSTVAEEFCISFPVVESKRAIALSVEDAGQTTSHEPLAVLAIVTTPSAPVPVVVSVILLPSTSFTLPPEAESVTVWEVPSDEFVIVWFPVFVPLVFPMTTA